MRPRDIANAIAAARAAGPSPLVSLADRVREYFAALDRYKRLTDTEGTIIMVAVTNRACLAEKNLRESVATPISLDLAQSELENPRIVSGLRRIGADLKPDRHWQSRTLVAAERAHNVWWRRALRRIGVGR